MELISPGETVARSLQIPLTEPCYCLKRVRNAVGKPMVYTITYLKKSVNCQQSRILYGIAVSVSAGGT